MSRSETTSRTVSEGETTHPVERQKPVAENLYTDSIREAPTTGDEAIDTVLKKNWTAIQTKRRMGRLVTLINIRLLDDDGLERQQDDNQADNVARLVSSTWQEMNTRVKINCSYGSILKHRTSGEVRYYHSSSNNASVFPKPVLIRTDTSLDEFFTDLAEIDIRELGSRSCPNTSWQLQSITNVTFYLYRFVGMGKIGCDRSTIPKHILNNRALLNARGDTDDRLCFFRCLALRLQCKCEKSNCKCSILRRRCRVNKQTKSLFIRYTTRIGMSVLI